MNKDEEPQLRSANSQETTNSFHEMETQIQGYEAKRQRQGNTRNLGRFQLQEELGRGAFGIVYRALDPQLERMIALKLPRFDPESSRVQRARFHREARAAANLHHPNIVAIHDAGTVEGQDYIACAYIRGSTLREMLRRQGTPSQSVAARIVMQLASALAYAHREGIIHRDIKPENILLDEDGNPFILDFGLARCESGDVLKTHDGAILGTPAYMSPEQAEGTSSKVDGRTDQWALGVILFELLCGQRPFEGGQLQLLYAIRHVEHPVIQVLNPEVHVDLATICSKCLMKLPEQRYPSCEDLHDDLQRWLRDEAIRARRQSIVERLQRWRRRNPALARLTMLFGASVVLAVLAISSQWLRAEVNRVRAETNAAEALRQQLIAQQTAQDLAKQHDLTEQANRQLANEKATLELANLRINEQLNALTQKDARIQQEQNAKLEANRRAEREAELRSGELQKNVRLRYFGEIQAAKLALSAGDPATCQSLLGKTQADQRSLEYSILSERASYNSDYELISDVRQLPVETRDFYLSIHTPAGLTAKETLPYLPAIENARALDETGTFLLTHSAQFNWLKQQLPKNYVASFGNDPSEKLPNVCQAVLTHVVAKSEIHSDICLQSWLSHSGRSLVYTRPKVSGSEQIVVELEIVALKIDERLQVAQKILRTVDIGTIRLRRNSRDSLVLNWSSVDFTDWKWFAAGFGRNEQFAMYDAFDQSLRVWKVDDSDNDPYAVIDVSQDDVAFVSVHSNPLAWLETGVALIRCGGVNVYAAGDLSVIAESQFDEPIANDWRVTVSDSRRSVLAENDQRLEIRSLNGGPMLTTSAKPPIVEETFLLHTAIRKQAAMAGVAILDWDTTKLVEAPDLSWFCIKTAGLQQVEKRGKTITLPDDRVLVFRRKSNSVIADRRTLWKAPKTDRYTHMILSSDNRWCILYNTSTITTVDLLQRTVLRPAFSKEFLLGPIRGVDVSPASATLAIAVGDRIEVSRLQDGTLVSTLSSPDVASAKFSPDGQSMLVSSNDGIVRMHRTEGGEVTRQWKTVRMGASVIAFDPLEQFLVTGGQELAIRRWGYLDGMPSGSADVAAPLRRMTVFDGQDLLFLQLIDDSSLLLSWPDLRVLRRVPSQGRKLLDAISTVDKQRLIMVRDDALVLVDLESGMEILNIATFSEPIAAAAIMDDRRQVLTLDTNGTLDIVELHRPQL